MAQFTPTASPRGSGHYDSEEDLPYLHDKEETAGSGGEPGDRKPSGTYKPRASAGTSSREAGPSSRHRRPKENLGKAEQEAGGGPSAGGSAGGAEAAASQEQQELADAAEEDIKYTGDGSKQRGFRGWSRRKKAAVGTGGVLAGGIIGVFLMGIGPFQFIQLAQNLQDFHFGNNESMMDGRTMRIIRYARHNAYRNNLGVASNIIADIYETKLRRAGFEPDYNDPNGNPRRSIQAYTIDTNTPQGRAALGNLQANGVEIPDVGANGRVRITLRGEGSTVLSRKVISASLGSIGTNKVSSWMGGRLLKKRAGVDLHPLRNRLREEGEDYRDFRRRVQEEDQDRIRQGVQDGDIPRDPADNPDDPDGQPDRNQAAAAADDLVGESPDVTVRNLRRAVAGVGSALGIFSLICAADQFGDSIGNIQYTNLVLPLMRLGVAAISTGNQVMSNQDFNMQELGAKSAQLFDQETGLGWSAAKSIQAEYGVGEPSGPDMPDAAKPNKDKPAFFEVVDTIIGSIPGGGTACNFLTSTAGQYFSSGVDALLTAISGGSWIVVRIVGGEVLGTIGGVAAEPFINDLAQWLAGEPLEEFASGALYGNYVNYGSRLAANDSALSTGGTELPDSEVAILDQDRQDMYKTQLQHKSMYARLFDPHERGSLVARTLLQNPNISTPQAAGTHFAQLPTTIFTQIGSSFSNLFSPKLKALNSSQYDYGFPEYGYKLALQEDQRFDDPFENARLVNEHGIEQLNEEYGDCFNMSITSDGKLETTTANRMDEIPDDCKDDSNEMLVRYRFYIADTVAMKSLICLNSLDESACDELGFGNPSTSGGGGATLNGVECPANMEPHPSQAGYFKMPEAPNGEYHIYSVDARRYGSRQLVCVLYSVGLAYNEATGGKVKLQIGDLNGGEPHASHYKGIAADVDGKGEFYAADHVHSPPPYSTEYTIMLGKLFIDTGVMKNLWWCDPGDGSLDAIIAYANNQGTPLQGAQCEPGHDNHFHVDILDEYALPGSFTP